ncbi:MAG: 6-pyruvoyl-tetrahydropterin synthase-related protein [Patescibacteria group bacterium]
MKKNILILILLMLPSFGLMLKPGIFTMHDAHPFRMQQFTGSVADGVFPARWAPDAENGYGEPVFNFYGQFPYWVGEIFVLLGFSVIDATKGVFIFSLVASGVGMYWLMRRFCSQTYSMLASVLYVYAPYRSVDIWVRGALNEAFAFVFFPLILYFLDEAIITSKPRHFVGLGLTTALLLITHNLSFVMFSQVLVVWAVYRIFTTKRFSSVPGLMVAALLSILLSAFYILPVAIETSLVSLETATQDGYYNFQLHYTTLKQLFVTRFWGYGASVWSTGDGMSFSVGTVQGILLGLAGLIAIYKRSLVSLVLVGIGIFCLFLTHGKSDIIWRHLPYLTYIQFPWRYLSPAAFFIAASIGASFSLIRIPKIILIAFLVLAIATNIAYFRPDIWRDTTDAEYFSGASLHGQMDAHKDFWPKTAGDPPRVLAPKDPWVESGLAAVTQVTRATAAQTYAVVVESDQASIVFPTVYFPGWTALVDGVQQEVYPHPDSGLITIDLSSDNRNVILRFIDTWPRVLGNIISAAALLGIISFLTLRHAKN